MAKYGNVINISVPCAHVGSISDVQGNYVCEIDQWAAKFIGQSGPTIDFHIDLETGAILNWKVLTKDQIVDLIEEHGNV